MKTTILIFTIISGLLTSCYQVYDPHVDTVEKVLDVDGMITNKTDPYSIDLTYADLYNSGKQATPVSVANVYVTDNHGNSYIFTEKNKGKYLSDSLQFTGIPGLTYQLHIITTDGAEYESDPQRLLPEVDPDSVYTEFDTETTLDTYTGSIVSTHGADILIDIINKSDTLPRFRFTSNLVIQYYYAICPYLQNCDYFYCWMTDNANTSLNLTYEKYSQSSASIKKHEVCFLDDNLNCFAPAYVKTFSNDYSYYYAEPTTDSRTFLITHRVLYLNTYSLNNETYMYYRSMDEQLQSEGKLFDLVAAQLNGNIKCISNPEKKALGFFEASSVSYSAYKISFRDLTNSQPSIIKTPYILPPALKGCWINKVPSFWILI